jgi:hypothetical protein
VRRKKRGKRDAPNVGQHSASLLRKHVETPPRVPVVRRTKVAKFDAFEEDGREGGAKGSVHTPKGDDVRVRRSALLLVAHVVDVALLTKERSLRRREVVDDLIEAEKGGSQRRKTGGLEDVHERRETIE